LEIQQVIKVELLNDYIGSLTEDGLATLRDQRRRWEDSEGVAPFEQYGRGGGDCDEDDEDDDGAGEEGGDDGDGDGCGGVGEGWTLVSPKKRPQCTRGRGRRGIKGKGDHRGVLGYGHSNGGRRAHI